MRIVIAAHDGSTTTKGNLDIVHHLVVLWKTILPLLHADAMKILTDETILPRHRPTLTSMAERTSDRHLVTSHQHGRALIRHEKAMLGTMIAAVVDATSKIILHY